MITLANAAALALTVFTCSDSSMTACIEEVTVYPTEQACADAAIYVLTNAQQEHAKETIVAYCTSNIAAASKSTF